LVGQYDTLTNLLNLDFENVERWGKFIEEVEKNKD